jgi:nitrate/TMAO reductase-like tetraheme cytochrome c subunit
VKVIHLKDRAVRASCHDGGVDQQASGVLKGRKMRKRFWPILGLLVVGAIVGFGGAIASLEANHFTSTDAFCTSCHAMTSQAEDPYFRQSAHRSNAEGVHPGCSDCHIPKSNWFIETYTHVTEGTHDLLAHLTHDFNDPRVWGARRAELEKDVRATMHAQDSVTCRGCHDAATIQPKSDAGRQSHAMLKQGNLTCVDCHANLVHPKAASDDSDDKDDSGK